MTQTLFSPFISLCRVNRKLQTAPPYCARPPLEAVNSIFPLSRSSLRALAFVYWVQTRLISTNLHQILPELFVTLQRY